MTQLAGKFVIVTGGATALGCAAAARIVQEGARVALIGPQSDAQVVKASGVSVQFVAMAAGRADSIARAVEQTAREAGQLDALVNVLPDVGTWKPFAQKSDAEFTASLDGVHAIASAMRAAHPFLKRAQGRVVNVSSAYGASAFAHLSDAVTADYALQGLTRAVAVEWAKEQVLVNHLAPGALDVPRLQQLRAHAPQRTDNLIRSLALQRLGDPVEDFGGALMFLLSDEACFLVGHTVYADGGQHLVAPVFEPGASFPA